MSPKQKKGTAATVNAYGTNGKLSFSFGQNTTILQAEVYAITSRAVGNTDRAMIIEISVHYQTCSS
jgi:hypothetical protein